MEIEFRGHYDQATFFRAVALANQPSRREKIIRTGITIFFTVIYIAYFALAASKEDLSSFDIFRTARHVIALPFIGYILLQPYIATYFSAQKMWKDPATSKPLAGMISSQGIAYISSRSRRDFTWDKFARARKADDLIALLTVDGTMAAFPRGFLRSDDDWRVLQQWIDAKVIEAKN